MHAQTATQMRLQTGYLVPTCRTNKFQSPSRLECRVFMDWTFPSNNVKTVTSSKTLSSRLCHGKTSFFYRRLSSHGMSSFWNFWFQILKIQNKLLTNYVVKTGSAKHGHELWKLFTQHLSNDNMNLIIIEIVPKSNRLNRSSILFSWFFC